MVMEPQLIKVGIVGDRGVGKTCLLMTYLKEVFPTDVPATYDASIFDLVVDDREVRVGCFDTAGAEEFDSVRPLVYPQADVFMLCFSLMDPKSHENVRCRWYPEFKRLCPNTPVILVGTKTDAHDNKEIVKSAVDKNSSVITSEEGLELAMEIDAAKYVECSALMQKGLEDVFNATVRAVPPRLKKSKKCALF